MSKPATITRFPFMTNTSHTSKIPSSKNCASSIPITSASALIACSHHPPPPPAKPFAFSAFSFVIWVAIWTYHPAHREIHPVVGAIFVAEASPPGTSCSCQGNVKRFCDLFQDNFCQELQPRQETPPVGSGPDWLGCSELRRGGGAGPAQGRPRHREPSGWARAPE